MARLFDGFVNAVARLGRGQQRDKFDASTYTFTPLTDDQLMNTYRSSALARKVVDLPAEDAMREWREWHADKAQIEAIEAEEKRLKLQGMLILAKKAARLWGGAALYLDLPGDPGLPVNVNALGRGALKRIVMLRKAELRHDEIVTDPRQPEFGRPARFFLQTAAANDVMVHPSRLVLMTGEETPGSPIADIWGDSVLQAVRDNLLRQDGTEAAVASLAFEAKIDVFKINGLREALENTGEAGEKQFMRLAESTVALKGVNGAVFLDKEDEYEQKSASFGGLDAILDRFMQLTAAAASMPVTLLFGKSPAGLNATGDADIRGYYDRVKVVQTLELDPAMDVLNEALIRSALGSRPAEVYHTWRPLWQPTDKERAEVGKTLSETIKIGREINAASDEALGTAWVNAMTEAGVLPGLEAAVEEFPAVEDDPLEMGLPVDAVETPEQRREALRAVGDATPRTLYVHRKVLNGDAIIAWAKAQGFKTTLPADDLHVTVTFSRAPVDWMKMGEAWESELKVSAGGPRMMERFGEARVLLFTASELRWRHERMVEEGAIWDHPEYQPHITISYDPDAPDLAEVEPYQGEIVLGPEVFAEVNEDWKSGVIEE